MADDARSEVAAAAAGRRSFARDNVIVSPALHRLQLRHFVLFDVMPALGTIGAVLFAPTPTWLDIALLVGMWLVTGLGITCGFHRYFSHRGFSATPAVSIALLVMGSMAGRGPMISWVAMHRRHHELSDREGDPHSPWSDGGGFAGRFRGLVHAHMTWMMKHDYPNVVHYTPDLLKDPHLMAANTRYYAWVVCGLVLPAAVGGLVTWSATGALTGLLWGGCVRMFVVEQTMSLINSLAHLIGSRPFPTRGEHSGNIAILALPTWGEAWHNNHHAFPWSAAFGLRWWQFDPGYWAIALLAKLGLAWDVKTPARDLVQSRLRDAVGGS